MNRPLHLFDGFGIELEYMIVDRNTRAVRPVCDELIKLVAHEYTSEIDLGLISWSNELALHVVEFKTNGPAAKLDGLAGDFQGHVSRANELLASMNAQLMPGAAHPWMDPLAEMRLWPHEYSPVYEAYDRIFSCRGHGWANLQSMHINLPFHGDAEFRALHAAIRVVLPILPALAAASPIMDAQRMPNRDHRLETYRHNADRIPLVAGQVIPEPVFSHQAYTDEILNPLYAAIRPHDPDGILQHEFLNSRGAIARFDRGAIEIRVIDVQECPTADLAIAEATVELVRALTHERWSSIETQTGWSTEALADIFLDCVRDAEDTVISNRAYLELFGVQGDSVTAGQLWRTLLRQLHLSEQAETALTCILTHGTLATRMLRSLDGDLSRDRLHALADALCRSLDEGRMFEPEMLG